MPHTDGPWFQDAEIADEALCRIRSADGEPIADVFALDRGYDAPDHEQTEALANARLIAAAPDLLAALQAIADFGQAEGSPFAKSVSLTARNAIAKAKSA